MYKGTNLRCLWVVGVVSFFSLFFYTGYSFSAPTSKSTSAPAPVETAPEKVQREPRVYDNPLIAEPIMRVTTMREFYEITESLLELFKSVDVITPKTLNVAGQAYVDAAERVSNGTDTFGFAQYRPVDSEAQALEAKVLPLKHELLSMWSLTLLMYYAKKVETFYSSRVLRQIIKNQHLSAEAEAELVDVVLKIHLSKGENVGRFLRDSVIAPIMARQPKLYKKLSYALEKDVIKDQLFDHEAFAKMKPQEAMMEHVRMLRVVGIEANIVESREGAVEGRPEDPRVTEEKARARKIERTRRSVRRGRH